MGAVVGAKRELVGLDRSRLERALEAGDRFGRSGPMVERPGGDLARAAVDDRVQVHPAVLACPELGHIHMPQLFGTGDLEETGSGPPTKVAGRLQESVLVHDPLHPLAIHRLSELARRDRSDHPRPIGRIRVRDLHDRRVCL